MDLLDKFRGLIEDCETIDELNDFTQGLNEDYRVDLSDEIEEKRQELGEDVPLNDATDAELAAEIENRPALLDMLEETHFSDQTEEAANTDEEDIEDEQPENEDEEDLDEDDETAGADEEEAQEDAFDPEAAQERVESFADEDEDTEFADALLSEDLDTDATLIVRDVVEDKLQPIPSAVSYTEEIIEDADLSDEQMNRALNLLDQLKRETGLLETDASRQTALDAAERLGIEISEDATTEQILTRINEDAPDVTEQTTANDSQNNTHLRGLMARAMRH